MRLPNPHMLVISCHVRSRRVAVMLCGCSVPFSGGAVRPPNPLSVVRVFSGGAVRPPNPLCVLCLWGSGSAGPVFGDSLLEL